MLLKELPKEKLFEVVSKNETLRRSFDDYVWDCEFDYISDKLHVVEKSISNYEIGLNNPNFIRICDYECFVILARKCENYFGLNEECEKKLSQCEKLMDTNLFEHHAKLFAEMWFESEIQSVVRWCEELSFNVYCGKNPEDTYDYLLNWADNVDFIYDEEDGSVWKPMEKVS